jgi:hypothetical protein
MEGICEVGSWIRICFLKTGNHPNNTSATYKMYPDYIKLKKYPIFSQISKLKPQKNKRKIH